MTYAIRSRRFSAVLGGAVCALALLATPAISDARPVLSNGSLSTPVAPANGALAQNPDGWTGTGELVGVDQAKHPKGSRSFQAYDLNRLARGQLATRIRNVRAGETVRILWDHSANSWNGTFTQRTYEVLGEGGVVQPFTTPGPTDPGGVWELDRSYEFTASVDNPSITFSSTVDGAYGAYVANIRLASSNQAGGTADSADPCAGPTEEQPAGCKALADNQAVIDAHDPSDPASLRPYATSGDKTKQGLSAVSGLVNFGVNTEAARDPKTAVSQACRIAAPHIQYDPTTQAHYQTVTQVCRESDSLSGENPNTPITTPDGQLTEQPEKSPAP